MKNSDFKESKGEIKIGDWFKSKIRTENKFFHYVQVKEITENGYIDAANNWQHNFDDVIYKATLTNTDAREEDILKLCEAVLYASPNCYDNPNGAYETTCPFCYAQDFRGGGEGKMYSSMWELEHKQDCVYLIAKDLSTGLL